MGFGDFSPELCEQLFSVRKIVASNISWKQGESPLVFLFQAKVLAPDGAGLDLTGYWNRHVKHNRTRWGFSLKYFGHCVRSYDMASYHKNPGEAGKIRGPHKHKYSSSRIPRYAYKPNPPICEVDANKSLMDFLEEANTELPRRYQYFMFPG
jgi:hypothetical protein